MLIADAETGEIADANPYLEALFGYRRDELVGRKVWEVDPLCGIPDPESVLARIREREMERFPELVVKSKSGRAIHVEVVANAYMEGARAQIQFNIRDITDANSSTGSSNTRRSWKAWACSPAAWRTTSTTCSPESWATPAWPWTDLPDRRRNEGTSGKSSAPAREPRI